MCTFVHADIIKTIHCASLMAKSDSCLWVRQNKVYFVGDFIVNMAHWINLFGSAPEDHKCVRCSERSLSVGKPSCTKYDKSGSRICIIKVVHLIWAYWAERIWSEGGVAIFNWPSSKGLTLLCVCPSIWWHPGSASFISQPSLITERTPPVCVSLHTRTRSFCHVQGHRLHVTLTPHPPLEYFTYLKKYIVYFTNNLHVRRNIWNCPHFYMCTINTHCLYKRKLRRTSSGFIFCFFSLDAVIFDL